MLVLLVEKARLQRVESRRDLAGCLVAMSVRVIANSQFGDQEADTISVVVQHRLRGSVSRYGSSFCYPGLVKKAAQASQYI